MHYFPFGPRYQLHIRTLLSTCPGFPKLDGGLGALLDEPLLGTYLGCTNQDGLLAGIWLVDGSVHGLVHVSIAQTLDIRGALITTKPPLQILHYSWGGIAIVNGNGYRLRRWLMLRASSHQLPVSRTNFKGIELRVINRQVLPLKGCILAQTGRLP